MKRPTRPDRAPYARDVTENQRAILLRLFAGKTYEEVALNTGRKPVTIFNTVRRVRGQLGARTEYDLMRECIRRGIVTLDEIYSLADAIHASTADQPHDGRS